MRRLVMRHRISVCLALSQLDTINNKSPIRKHPTNLTPTPSDATVQTVP
jgi:hypothetical protein